MSEFMNSVWKVIVESNVLNLVSALLILFAGWCISLLFRKMIYSALGKMQLNRRLALCLPEETPGEKRPDAEKILSVVCFWFLFLLTILAMLTSLNLTEAASPIKIFLDKVMGYLPSFFAGALLAFIAWIVATAIKYLSLTAMSALHLDEKIEEHLDTGGRECKLSFSIASILYFLVFLCFAPAILSALKIEGVTAPLESMIGKVFNYLPNLAAAALIAFLGLFCAGILRKIAIHFFKTMKSGILFNAAESPEVMEKERERLANLVGIVVYALTAIPVVIAALSALRIDALTNSVSGLFGKILNTAGNLFGALLLIFAAYAGGRFVSKLVAQLLDGFGFNRLFPSVCFQKKEEQKNAVTPAIVAGQLSMLGIMLFSLIGAFEIMGFADLAALLMSFVPFAGKIIVAIIVFVIGIYLSNLAADAIRNRGIESSLAGIGIRAVVLFFAGALALHSTGIGGPIVQTAFTLILGAFAVAFAIAFGLGGREFATKKLQEWSQKDKK